MARGKRFSDKLSFVNSSINRAIAYKKDSVVYGKFDYWAKPSEILERRAGDCEDFAILKMTALLRAGIPAQSMSLVVLQDRRRGFFHAVLSVSTGSGTFILDNLSNLVLRDSDLPDYVPLYSSAPTGPGSTAQNLVQRRWPRSKAASRQSRPAKVSNSPCGDGGDVREMNADGNVRGGAPPYAVPLIVFGTHPVVLARLCRSRNSFEPWRSRRMYGFPPTTECDEFPSTFRTSGGTSRHLLGVMVNLTTRRNGVCLVPSPSSFCSSTAG